MPFSSKRALVGGFAAFDVVALIKVSGHFLDYANESTLLQSSRRKTFSLDQYEEYRQLETEGPISLANVSMMSYLFQGLPRAAAFSLR
jgi:hypothetical protein